MNWPCRLMRETHEPDAMRHSWTPTLNELQAFRACAATGSVTRAAQALGLTQSAVSRQIKTLEDALGLRLFRRLHRAIEHARERTALASPEGDQE